MAYEEHDEMKKGAIAWLRQQGFVDILVEAKIIVTGDSAGKVAPEKGNPRGTTLVPDVIGYSSDRKVIVECGSVGPPDRLLLFSGLGYEVYVWPYDGKEPYKWSEDVNYCRFCGRKFEHLGCSV